MSDPDAHPTTGGDELAMFRHAVKGNSGFRVPLGWLASGLISVSVVITTVAENRSPYGRFEFLLHWPWILATYGGSLVLGVGLLGLLLSPFGDRHDLFGRYWGFFYGLYAVGGINPGIYLWMAFSILFVTPRTATAQLFMIIGAGLLCLIVISTLISERQRSFLVEMLHEGGRVGLTGYAALVSVTAIVVFGFLTYVLSHEGIIEISPSRPLDIKDSCWFYGYQLIKSVPVVNVADAYGWEPPFKSTSALLGTTTILFKLAVIVPTVSLIQLVWRRRQKETLNPT
jgi:hypothetical protein